MKSENIKIYIFDSSKLQRIFFSLASYSKTEIVGYVSNVRFTLLEMNALQETIEFLINKELPIYQNENLSVPDFENKIEFNHLSEIVRNKLIEGSYQEGLLQDYFDRHPTVKEELQRKFLFLYKEANSKSYQKKMLENKRSMIKDSIRFINHSLENRVTMDDNELLDVY